jgi:acetyl esterase/lipase
MSCNKLIIPVLAFLLLTAAKADQLPTEILLWPKGAPGSESKTSPEKKRITPQGDIVLRNVHKPSITPFLPTGKASGVAVIIAPGGGHAELWISHEGYSPAKVLSQFGIAAFVLKYRLARDSNSTYSVDREELADIHRAIRLVRSRAKEWNIDPNKIGVIGFSAGGELAALSGMHYSPANENATDPIDRESDKPDFEGLVYPGNISRLTVLPSSPPAFIAAGYQDRNDISIGAAELYVKYKQANVPAELHIYGNVGHGFGVRSTNKGAYSHWPDEFYGWLFDMGFIKNKY